MATEKLNVLQPTLFTLSCSLLLVVLFTWQVSCAAAAGSGDGNGLAGGGRAGALAGADEEYNDNNSNRPEDVDYDSEDLVAKRHMGSIAASSGVRNFSPYAAKLSGGSYYGDNGLKLKRFLGTLARGGWFPRQFRGYVYPSPMGSGFQQKRHIGSVARLGWLPLRDEHNMHF